MMINNFLVTRGGYSLYDIENIPSWERQVYLQLYKNDLEEEIKAMEKATNGKR
jgi:hypothetical protein